MNTIHIKLGPTPKLHLNLIPCLLLNKATFTDSELGLKHLFVRDNLPHNKQLRRAILKDKKQMPHECYSCLSVEL